MNEVNPRVLVVDDEPGVVALVTRFAQDQGFAVESRSGGREAIADLATLQVDAALVDLRMPDVGGLDVLRAIHEVDPACQVILITAHASVDTAIEAVKLGALDYLSKPIDFARLGELLGGVREGLQRRQHLMAADSRLASRVEFHGMIGRSPVMQELFDMLRRLAPHVRTAVVTGDTGTGKELVARALHKLGGRRERRFISCNCAAIVESLFESELFGHVRGAFTGATENKVGLFEAADGGTLFLDEIGELPLSMQAKLLRAVEYGEVMRVGSHDARRVDVRVVAATNRDLKTEVEQGRFREDLYYRLNVVEIPLPPLRDRRDDIPYLSAAFIREFAQRFQKPLIGISPGAERLLHQAPWPGNIRELRHTLERACMLSEGRLLSEREVLAALRGPLRPVSAAAGRGPGSSPAGSSTAAPPTPLPRTLRAVERDEVQQALQRTGGNKAAAARELGLSRRSFYRRLASLGID